MDADTHGVGFHVAFADHKHGELSLLGALAVGVDFHAVDVRAVILPSERRQALSEVCCQCRILDQRFACEKRSPPLPNGFEKPFGLNQTFRLPCGCLPLPGATLRLDECNW